LIGSEVVQYLDRTGWAVHGIDNNMRRSFFGELGDTTWNLARLKQATHDFIAYDVDVRDRGAILELVASVKPDLVVHCAAQPSHQRPFDDFDVNAVGTLNLLEAVRRHCGEAPFVFMSTNKVYGDVPNEFPLMELETRFDYANPLHRNGVDENCRVDSTMHSLFGASKLAADVLVQEYGRYFGLPTVCFRAGCLTGSYHSAVELHGFLAYLAKATRARLPYRVYGHLGKQVRDNIHASDVCGAIMAFYERPRTAAVYNLGGGRANSISMLEAIERCEELFAQKLQWAYIDRPRQGDHICYISNIDRFRNDYPEWQLSFSLDDIFSDLGRSLKAIER
jgi:CDP-paratose 2-epimerase